MGSYSIKELEQLSGVKAHTIRIWEQRYGLLNPDRTDTNIRTYSDEELRHLLNVTLLNNHGFKISKISDLTRDQIRLELDDLLLSSNVDSLPLGDQINGLILSMLELDESKFLEIYNLAREKMGVEDVVVELITPFLQKVGIMWGINQTNPAQEHFISNLIRRKLQTETDKLPLAKEGKNTFILYLREGELHELGMLVINYIIRNSGFKTLYLGANVPIEDVIGTANISKASHMITSFTVPVNDEDLVDYLNKVAENTEATLWYNTMGPFDSTDKLAPNIALLEDIQSLKTELAELS